jgi:molybdate transport system substrate-binding protein
MRRNFLLIISLLIFFVGCANKGSNNKEVIILAAAGLTEVFTELEKNFEKVNDIDINISFSGSQMCVTAIKEGVFANIFASANEKYMDELIKEGYINQEDKIIFAKNKLIIITYKDNKKIKGLKDLSKEDTKIIIGNESTPIGKYTVEMLNNIVNKYGDGFSKKFYSNIISKENNVKSVAVKIELNEGDAGIVYFTDYNSSNKDKNNKIEIEDIINQLTT